MIPLYDHNPARSRPLVTRVLIYANVVVFAVQWWLASRGVPWVAEAFGMVPSRLTADPLGEWPKLLASAFLHGGVAHLGWNMLFLHIFGDNVEDRLGHVRYAVFYLLSAVAAALAQYAMDPLARIPMVGASGAIAGVLGAYLVLYPRAPIAVVNPVLPLWLLLGPLFALPAWFVVGMWFLGNVFGGLASLGSEDSGGIAFFAHLGGFCAGLLLVRPFSREAPPDHPPRAREARTAPGGARRGVFWKDDDRPFWK